MYCDNNPIKRIDPNGNDWHNPGQVWVDPRFAGDVCAVGEPDPSWGDKQTGVRVKPGQMTHSKMDVDLVYIRKPGGQRKGYFLMGRGYIKNKLAWVGGLIASKGDRDAADAASRKQKEQTEQYWVDEFGDLHSSDAGLTVIEFDADGTTEWPESRWKGDTDRANKNPCPQDRMSSATEKPGWVRPS